MIRLPDLQVRQAARHIGPSGPKLAETICPQRGGWLAPAKTRGIRIVLFGDKFPNVAGASGPGGLAGPEHVAAGRQSVAGRAKFQRNC